MAKEIIEIRKKTLLLPACVFAVISSCKNESCGKINRNPLNAVGLKLVRK